MDGTTLEVGLCARLPRIVHDRIRGRLRISIEAIRRDPPQARALSAVLTDLPGVLHVSASAVTGTVLVVFDPARLGAREVLDSIERVGDPLGSAAVGPSLGSTLAGVGPSRSSMLAALARDLRERSLLEERVASSQVAARVADAPPWHALDVRAVLAALDARARGLGRSEAAERLARLGPNALTPAPRRSELGMLAGQLKSAPIALLAGSAAISVLTGGITDAVVIAVVIVVNAVIGYLTERRAEAILGELDSGGARTAQVRRDGRVLEIDAAELVVGDVIQLSPGTIIGADARVIEIDGLTVDESALTGESLPVGKDPEAASDARAPLADRSAMLHRGTIVTGGSGLAVVVATGDATEIGRIRALAAGIDDRETPLQRELRGLGARLAGLAGVLCGGVVVLGLLRGRTPFSMLTSALSLAVAAVPEGLPTIAITTLALGVRRMRAQGAVVRTLGAVEALGAVQSLCLDKTGTITINRMTVERLVAGGCAVVPAEHPACDGDLRALLEAIVLCSEAAVDEDGTVRGSPTESALARVALDLGLDVRALRRSRPLVRTRLRSERRGTMSTVHELPDGASLLVVKGSPGEVLAACDAELVLGRARPLDDHARAAIENENERLAGSAYRVLGVATRRLERSDVDDETGLVHVGLVAMADPPREGIAELLRELHRAGIDTAMITGDQAATAHAIARRVGLGRNGAIDILDSTRVDAMEPEVLRALAPRVEVFARVSPAHKLAIVRALQEGGRVVAMTGDGVNDAPALKAADVGVALGRSGTDAARELADVVLLDDRLETMVAAIAQGRAIRDDIGKAVRFVLATNLSEILVTAVGVGAGVGEPLTSLQLLWLNVLTDVFPELALALEPPESDVLARPPADPSRPMFSRREVARITIEGALLAGASLGAFAWGRGRWGADGRASTLAFASLTAGQLLHTLSARSPRHVIFDRERLARNPAIGITVVSSIAGQMLAERSPMLCRILGIVPIGAKGWALALATGVLPLLLNEGLKVLWRREDDASGTSSSRRT